MACSVLAAFYREAARRIQLEESLDALKREAAEPAPVGEPREARAVPRYALFLPGCEAAGWGGYRCCCWGGRLAAPSHLLGQLSLPDVNGKNLHKDDNCDGGLVPAGRKLWDWCHPPPARPPPSCLDHLVHV
jgi:hypothetical protein